MTSSLAPFYAGWSQMNDRIVDALSTLTPEQLALPVGSPTWPIWASASHIAGVRVYWLCHVCKERGAATTPFTDPTRGWEDDLDRPRSADELVHAFQSTWRIVERCLATWTTETLGQEVRRLRSDGVVTQIHTRQSILMRLLTHDVYHTSEISLVLGSHGLGSIDLWAGLSRPADGVDASRV